MGGTKAKMTAASRAAKKAMNAVPQPRPRKPPAFSMAMALRIREGRNVNAKPLQEGQGSLSVLRYLEPKALKRTHGQPGSEGLPQESSSDEESKLHGNILANIKSKKAASTFMSIQELNEKIAASRDAEVDPSSQTSTADGPVDRAGLPSLEQYIQDDVVFVSIDTEMVQDPEQSRYGITEVGMCLLDTRDLRQISDFGVRGDSATKLFDAHHFGLYENTMSSAGDDMSSARTRIRSRSYKYIFGNAAVKWIPSSRIEREMSRLIYQKLGNELGRKIVFLYFDQTFDMQFLNEANVFLNDEFPNHVVIDTQLVGAAAVIGKHLGKSRASAEAVYDHLGVPTTLYDNAYKCGHVANKQHNAGNDAVFQMQAWIAGLCLQDEHWKSLHRGEKLRPEMGRAWKGGRATRLYGVSDNMEEPFEAEEKSVTAG
ncbi:hypothetical protein LTR24_004953 [Lithohypha guttulata]|uniref:Gfd2/YDR514C-like C-terminal domain-containing protein n=1 Tax=Lithohypha guttulata TaxID=1690604 RepID=A0ABR0KAI2_9EURO|nr:hypothetical protein LTR24_004953 [Lithohypha guttulata]